MSEHRAEVVDAKGRILVISQRQFTLMVCVPGGDSEKLIADTINQFPWRNTPGPWKVLSDYGACPDFEFTRRHVCMTCK